MYTGGMENGNWTSHDQITTVLSCLKNSLWGNGMTRAHKNMYMYIYIYNLFFFLNLDSNLWDSFWFFSCTLSSRCYLYRRSMTHVLWHGQTHTQTVRQEGCYVCDQDLLTHIGGRPGSRDEEVVCAHFAGWVNSREDSQSENHPVKSYPEDTYA